MKGYCRALLAGLLLPWLLSGCASFYDEILLNADGSGSYRLVLYVKKVAVDEDVNALELAVRDRAAKVAKDAGFTLRSVGLRRDGSLLEIEVTADFRDLSVFASPALAVRADQSLWSFVVPREMSFQGGRFAARVLRDSAPPAAHPIRASFKGREGRFTVHFPCEVARSDGEVRERLVNWSFPLERLCDQPVEMTAVTRADLPLGALALGALLLLGLGVLIGSIVRTRRARSGPGRAG
jgi:hypothetical protein